MSGVLRYTVVVRQPGTLMAVALLEGDPVPEWATDLVHADDLDNGSEAPASETGDKPRSYADLSKSDLKAEVEARNEARDEDDLIEVDAPGNKAELIAALEADDAAQA